MSLGVLNKPKVALTDRQRDGLSVRALRAERARDAPAVDRQSSGAIHRTSLAQPARIGRSGVRLPVLLADRR
jgi:hypothetical protein